MKRFFTIVVASLACLGFILAGCDATQSQAPAATPEPAEITQADFADVFVFDDGERSLIGGINEEYIPGSLQNQIRQPQPGEGVAILHTNFGQIGVRLFYEHAPLAVENFVTHARNGYFDGLIFHRVINNFMIQGGDPDGTGGGGHSIWGSDFGDELSPNLRHISGALAMANRGPATNGSQFYIVQNNSLDPGMVANFQAGMAMYNEVVEGSEYTYGQLFPSEFEFMQHYLQHGGTPHLDFGHTVFGQVFMGMDIVNNIAATPVGSGDRPIEDVIIETIEIKPYDN